MKRTIRVVVVGAGAAGLCALRHLTQSVEGGSVSFSVCCFEKAAQVGGTWMYTECVGSDEHGLPVHSSMYESLRTNLPKECMAFPDFSFPDLPSFVGHQDVQKYLEDYAAHFDVLKYIKFKTVVTLIQPVANDSNCFGTSWQVTVKTGPDFSQVQTNIFDAVLLCNGHYAIPKFPIIPGLDTFPGDIIHSHDYRRPDSLLNKRVVLLGAASSGQDLSIEISTVAQQVFLSHNKPRLPTPLPENVQQKPGIRKVEESRVEFLDGSIEDVDSLLLCTGYHHDYSFLAPECGIQVDDSRITPLFKHMLHTKYPNFGMLGVCKVVVPFPMFDVQVRFFRAVLDGTVVLSSEEDMNRDTEGDYKSRIAAGSLHRHAHVLDERQYDYNDQLADLAQTPRLPDHYKQLCQMTRKMRQDDLIGYKKTNFVLDTKTDKYRIAESLK